MKSIIPIIFSAMPDIPLLVNYTIKTGGLKTSRKRKRSRAEVRGW